MIRIFEHIDNEGDTLLVDAYDTSLVALVRSRDGRVLPVELPLEKVTELRAALLRHDPTAVEGTTQDVETLDPARVDALFLAANVAKDLRSGGPLGSGAASHETVLAYALFLLDELPIPAVQQ